ncbi:hypothetical protein RIR_jg21777.t1 [Rhizophagus irregularis DAOM 181602=DAOM 197198]|nr:hypothetical protein RIR_jg21777.t1 [Rhizophagus irregularis DAOM 181602=DAOM 197198]
MGIIYKIFSSTFSSFLNCFSLCGIEDGFGLGLRNDLDGLNFEKRHPPGFGFHKGDALPRPGFRFGLLK